MGQRRFTRIFNTIAGLLFLAIAVGFLVAGAPLLFLAFIACLYAPICLLVYRAALIFSPWPHDDPDAITARDRSGRLPYVGGQEALRMPPAVGRYGGSGPTEEYVDREYDPRRGDVNEI
jgi:hypothetical protein